MSEHPYTGQPTFTAKQVIDIFGISRIKFNAWVESEILPYVIIDGGLMRFPRAETEALFRWLRDDGTAREPPRNPELISSAPPSESVYFLQQEGGDSLVKIGWTRLSIDARVTAIQAMSPVPLRLVAKIAGGIDLERRLHKHFAAERRHGEWFEPSDRLMAFIGAETEGV